MNRTYSLNQSKLIISIITPVILCIFIVPFIMSANFEAWTYMNLVTWILLIIFTIVYKESIFALYIFYFGLVFVMPPIILTPEKFLQHGWLVQDIYLPINIVPTLLGVITIFLFLSIFLMGFINDFEKNDVRVRYESKLRFSISFYISYFICFLFVSIFNIQEATAVFNEGYGALKSGDLSVQKGLHIFILDMIFISMTFILVYLRRFIWLPLFIFYTITLLFVGERLPPILFLFFLSIAYFRVPYKSSSIIITSIILFFVAVPFLMAIAVFREGLDDWSNNFLYFYTDIWNVIGHSFDTLKASILSSNSEITVDVSPFAKVFNYVDVISNRIFGVDLNLEGRSFGHQFTKELDPEMFELDRTFSSSAIAEAYFFFNFSGIIFYAFFVLIFVNIIKKNSMITSPFSVMLFAIFSSRFFATVRGELFGNIFDIFIQIIFIIPFLIICVLIFMKKKNYVYKEIL